MIGHPASGHVNPTLPVVAELVRRGERVVYYATQPFRDKIESTGAEFRALADQSMFERNLAKGGILGGMAGLIETAEEILPALLQQVQQDAPDYLLVEAHALWGNLLAQILGLPAVTLCSMFAMNERLLSVHDLAGHLYTSAETAREGLMQLNRYYATARCVDHHWGTCSPGMIGYLANPQALNIVFTAREFQIGAGAFDDSYKFVGPTSGIRVEGVDNSSAFDDTALRGPAILIAMGTMYNEELGLYKACFEAFADSPYQVVMAIGHRVDRAALGEIPANFLVHAYIPQLEILARSVLFVTHGGINSAHESMLSGVPMLVLPAAADHFVVAGQVEAVGAGFVLPRNRADAASMRLCAERILADETYRENSARMGESLRRGGGAQRAVDEISTFIQTQSQPQEAVHVRI
jgi:MGT family glycosyltransferase